MTDYGKLPRDIKNEKCILFLGPEICKNKQGTKFYELKYKKLCGLDEYIDSYYKNEDLFLFKDEIAKDDACYEIQDLYKNEFSDEIYTLIAAIPFHLIINFSPDLFLPKIFDRSGLPYNFHYFNKKKTRQDIPEPTYEVPLIYNLFGSIEDEESLVLTHTDLFDYLSTILGDNSQLPDNLRLSFQEKNIKNFIFIGFDLNKWYIQLILRLLKLDKYKSKLRSYATGSKVNERNKSFCEKHFQIQIISDNCIEYIKGLYQACQKKKIKKVKSSSIVEKIDKIDVSKIDEYIKQYDLISEKLNRLKKAHIYRTDELEKFKLEKQIEESEKMRDKLRKKLSDIEKRREKFEKRLSIITEKGD